jgi:hypothetical protein
VCFTEQELHAAPASTTGAEIQLLYRMVDEYNRIFSGEPRSVCMEIKVKKYICTFIIMFEQVAA